MSDWYGSADLEFPPKLGETKTICIIEGKRVQEPDHRFNLKKKGGVDAGFHLLLTLDTGKQFLVNTWALFFAFRDAGVGKGDTIEIKHPQKGEYIITRKKGSSGWDEES